jgi:pyruvate dehydrogenase E2 component (dihydrolipoamide acetyltransferase)
MAEIVTMPRLSDTMTEGVVAKWHKKVGDKVTLGDILAEIETDKATMEFEAFQEGYLLYIGVEEGKTAPVDSVLAILGNQGEEFQSLLAGGAPAPKVAAESAAAAPAPAAHAPAVAPAPVAVAEGRTKASPLARKLAEDKGVKLEGIQGTGEGGRIVKRDVESLAAGSATAVAAPRAVVQPGQESYTEETVSQMRKTIARRLAESKFSAPHFYLTMEIDMDQAVAARKAILDTTGQKVSFNDMVIKACAVALKQHPKVNSSWLGDKIRYNHHVNIGVAVAVDEGLLVPVVRFADQKGLVQISSEVREYADKAKNKKLQPADWEGNTFTISNLGMFGIEEFTAIINPPDSCILAVGGIKEVPVVKGGQVVPGHVMKVTLSCDHRVVDGATGASFLKALKANLEQPVNMLL